MKDPFRTLKLACYTTNISMSVVSNLPPVLFLTFRQLYGISYSLLGLLVVFNFVTQLTVDLIFSFFSHKFNIEKTVRATPLFCAAGLILFAIWPYLFPGNVYLGLVIGTMIFSAGSGLAEVLISPVIAAIPSDDPDRQMSGLHSVYAWGVVFVIIFSTLFLLAFGSENWPILTIILSLIPITSGILFSRSKIPSMQTPEKVSDTVKFLKDKGLWLCVFAIFLGGASECTMAQWCSSYLEQAMGIPKVWGDIFGVAMFSVLLGIGRSAYAKRGKNMGKVLLLGAIGATVCYFVAAVSPFPLIGLLACAFTGLCTSMLWPGNLVVAADRFPAGGVFLYAMMAAGGDLGASVAPQLVGVITDIAIESATLTALAQTLGLAPEQLGMKLGMLVGMLFPLVAIFVCYHIRKSRKEKGLEH
jgi:fucose permease